MNRSLYFALGFHVSRTLAGGPNHHYRNVCRRLTAKSFHHPPDSSSSSSAPQRIIGYMLDEEQHWVAHLECGHNQHVRHDPPMVERPWVLTPQGRDSMLGYRLGCKKCIARAPRDHDIVIAQQHFKDEERDGKQTSG